MSATGRGGERREDDFYETPAWAVRAILPFLPLHNALGAGSKVLYIDAGSGTGAIANELARTGRNVLAIEKHKSRALEHGHTCPEGVRIQCGDFFEFLPSEAWFAKYARTVVVMNPPYSEAANFIAKAVDVYGEAWALLRLGFLESLERVSFHRRFPSDVYVLARRPSFAVSLSCRDKCGWKKPARPSDKKPPACPACGGGLSATSSDSSAYGWFYFLRDRQRVYSTISLLDCKEASEP